MHEIPAVPSSRRLELYGGGTKSAVGCGVGGLLPFSRLQQTRTNVLLGGRVWFVWFGHRDPILLSPGAFAIPIVKKLF